MVLGLMYDRYEREIEGTDNLTERYPDAYRIAKKQHNLNISTFDKAIIGTNLGCWNKTRDRDDDDIDLLNFVCSDKKTDGTDESEDLIKLGDFKELTNFLKKIIGTPKEDHYV